MIKLTLFLAQVVAIAAVSIIPFRESNTATAAPQQAAAQSDADISNTRPRMRPQRTANADISNTRPRMRPQRTATLAPAVAAEVYCMAEALYWEGRNQSDDARQAIGNVIKNRVTSQKFPNSICGVVHQGPLDGSKISRHRCQFSYFCDGRSDNPAQSTNVIEQRAWADVQEMAYTFVAAEGYTDITNGSDYYLTHAAANAPSAPRWSKVYRRMASIGDHYFHKWN
jgi:spore germination cell wall hydrolase CwlJ-like protein